MTDARSCSNNADLAELVERVCNESMQASDWQRLETLLAGDEQAKRHYVAYLDLHAQLQWLTRDQGDLADDAATGADDRATGMLDDAVLPPIAIEVAHPLAEKSTAFSGNLLLSYGVAALTLVVVLWVAWSSRIVPTETRPSPDAIATSTTPTSPQWQPVIGRIASAIDCSTVAGSKQVAEGVPISQGETIGLQSGLVEVVYGDGARVILEGPCSYCVDSQHGGYLTLGKLTAGISEAAKRAASQKKEKDSPNFIVRTPTAIITDLGTEFGVKVEASGASETHVFQGSVTVLPTGVAAHGQKSIRLEQDESIDVTNGRILGAVTKRRVPFAGFVRDVPQRKRLSLPSTGQWLKAGERDPNWQIVARSDQPGWSAQTAVVTTVDEANFLANAPSQSQWISVDANRSKLPEATTYTFRANFDLSGFVPQTANIRGRFLADDHVSAIRINGQPIAVPLHGFGPFFLWTEFEITRGFGAGVNTLEIEVLNGGYEGEQPGSVSLMLCRVELEGSAIVDWRGKP